MKKQIKTVIIHNIVSPHIEPLFKQIGKKVDLTVLYCAQREKNRIWKDKPSGFSYKILPHYAIKFGGKDLFTYFINPTVIKELKRLQPDVVVSAGWDLLAYQLAFVYCKLNKIKFVLWSGSTKYETSWRRTVSLPLVKLMIRGSDAFIAYGTRAKEYLVSLGAKQENIFISLNTTNLDLYRKTARRYYPRREKIKEDLGIGKKKVIMYYGQLIERKGILELVKAFHKLKTKNPQAALLLVGSGILKERLNREIGTDKDIVIIDDPGDNRVGKYYAIADVFVLPSKEEVWGLVVNEAMVCGLPVIVSRKAGSSVDLVLEGNNGFTFNPSNHFDLALKIIKLIKNKRLIRLCGIKSQKLIQKYSPAKTLQPILDALNYALLTEK